MTRRNVFFAGSAWAVLCVLGGCATAPALPTEQQISASTAPSTVPIPLPTEVAAHASHTSTPSAASYNPLVHCTGDGSPTVVLEHGLGDNQFTWSFVQPEVATFTRVCSYTRAQKGQVPQPRTSAQIVADVHTIFGNRDIAGPYVLVEHSIGGFHVRLYAHHYPDEVVGMVLVDSSHEDQRERFLAVLPPTISDESPFLQGIAAADDPALNPEGFEWEASAAQVRASGSLGDRPLIVVTRGRPAEPSALGLPPDVAVHVEEVWQDLQQDLATLSTTSTHIIAEESGHFIHKDQPDLVVDAIRHVVDVARER